MRKRILNSLKMFMVVISIGLLSAFVLSCDGSSSSDGGGGGSQTPTITGESGNQVNLNGTWESVCFDDNEDGESDMVVMTVSGSTFTQVRKGWSSISCPGTPDTYITAVGTFVLGDEITVMMGEGSNVTATAVDGVFSSYEATVNNPDQVADLNADETCGFDDWAVGITKEILGSDCQPDSDFKDVMYIDDTVDPDVWYSGSEDVLDANGYPAELGEDMAMHRM